MDDVGERILRAATEILSAEGAPGVTVRKLAERAEVSTMGVYSRFGGKMGVVEALYLEGFGLLRSAVESVSHVEDPIGRIRGYVRAYRRTALENRSHYEIMFGRAVPKFEPSEGARLEALGAFEQVIEAAEYAIDQGVFDGPALSAAVELWALVHGHVSLELSGDLPSGPDGEKRLLRALDHAVIGLSSRRL